MPLLMFHDALIAIDTPLSLLLLFVTPLPPCLFH